MAYKVSMQKKKKIMVRRKRVVRKRATVSPLIKKYVARAVHSQLENKVCPFTTGTNGSSNSDIAISPMATPMTIGTNPASPTVINLSNCWTISNGTGQSDRVGSSINPTKWQFSYYIHNNGSSNVPCLVRMVIFKLKNGFGVPFTAQPTDILQTGNSSANGQGNYLDLNRPINEDKYTLYYSRVLKIGGAVSGTTIGNANNDFSCVKHRKVNLLKMQHHKIKFNDGGSTPSNSGLYCAFFFAPYGGDTLTSGNVFQGIYPQISYDVIGEFEDA